MLLYQMTWRPSCPGAGAVSWPGLPLPGVKAPTLLIAGGADAVVIRLNQEVFSTLRCDRRLGIVAARTCSRREVPKSLLYGDRLVLQTEREADR
jgi:hypothetical protein